MKNDIEKQNRIQNHENIRIEMRNQGFHECKCTISILKANLMALVTCMPFIFIFIWIYLMKWGSIEFDLSYGVYLLLLVFCLVIHEIIHGITWSFFSKNKWKSIHLGVMWKSLTPYCHCKEPLDFKGYICGGLMPLFVLGIGLFLISLFYANSMLLLLSIINVAGAGGDITIALMLLKHKDAVIIDHPIECGFTAFEK